MIQQAGKSQLLRLMQRAQSNIVAEQSVSESDFLNQIKASMTVDAAPSFTRSKPMAQTELKDFESQILSLANTSTRNGNPAQDSSRSGRSLLTSGGLGHIKDMLTSNSQRQDVLNSEIDNSHQ